MKATQLFGILLGIMMAFPAWATGIATVDFQKALTLVEEGKRTEAELNTLMTQKQGEVQQLVAAGNKLSINDNKSPFTGAFIIVLTRLVVCGLF